MTYNLLNYGPEGSASREPRFKRIIEEINPDILVVQEIDTQAGVDRFFSNCLNNTYSKADFYDTFSNLENAMFYKHDKIDFYYNERIESDPRVINKFVVKTKGSDDTLYIYGAHLKSRRGYESTRAAQIDDLKNILNSSPIT
jgi:endonuclease/exonuclease/phosphatase family metal-dependent hydrolase